MNFAITISGLLSAAFFLSWLSSFFVSMERPYIFLIAMILVFGGVFLPLSIRKRNLHKQKMQEIIEAYKKEGNKHHKSDQKIKSGKGWDMNNSPFRDRKSGLSWGGGNIHGINAERNSRK